MEADPPHPQPRLAMPYDAHSPVSPPDSDPPRGGPSPRSARAGTTPSAVVALVGAGQVGRALLGQLVAAGPELRRQGRAEIRVVALATSRRMRLSREFADPVAAAEALRDPAAPAEDTDLVSLALHLRRVASETGARPILVEATASDALADRYPAWLEAGLNLVTPSKQAGAGPLQRYRRILRAAREGGTRWRYEATVGAGLPVLSTLQDLLATGDEVVAVEGLLSGSLSFLLSEWERGEPFARSVPRARELGFTEPDPREDLSGLDVARKLVILAREAGSSLELGQVRVEGLVPDALATGDTEGFLRQLDRLDAALSPRLEALRAPGHVVRFVARYSSSRGAEAGLVALPPGHPFASLGPTGSAVAFTTRRYQPTPLTIHGPGAGPEVTAGGIFADLLRVLEAG